MILETFAVSDGLLYCTWQDASGSWQGPTPVEGPFAAAVAVDAAMGPTGKLEVFVIADDGVLYHSSLDPQGNWSDWAGPFGDGCPTGVTVVCASVGVAVWDAYGMNPGNLHVLAVAGGALYCNTLNLDGSWTGWRGPNWNNAPAGVTAVAATMGPIPDGAYANWDLFAVADGAIYYCYEGQDGMTAWQGPNFAGAPFSDATAVSAAIGPTGNVELFAVADNGVLYHNYLNPQGEWSTWSGPFDSGCPAGVTTVCPSVGVAVWSEFGTNPGNLHVLAIAGDSLYCNTLTLDDGWTGWSGPNWNTAPRGVTALAASMGTTPSEGYTTWDAFAVAAGTLYRCSEGQYGFNPWALAQSQDRPLAAITAVSVARCGPPPTKTCTFQCTNAVQQFPVPTTARGLQVTVIGACGGDASSLFGSAKGGRGAMVTGPIAVTPGGMLDLYVGGVGENHELPNNPAAPVGGGWNGGGNGWSAWEMGSNDDWHPSSGGGGGASDIRTASGTRLIVAGGGGGASPGDPHQLNSVAHNGGDATYPGSGDGNGEGVAGGDGASTQSPGAGGSSTPPGISGSGGSTRGGGGQGGGAQKGSQAPGGGGGGGLMGGGGGGSSGFSIVVGEQAGGGGGGSSFVPQDCSAQLTHQPAQISVTYPCAS